MNKDEILAMGAGRELDILVAIQVMKELKPIFIPKDVLELQLAGSPIKSPKGNWLCLCEYDEDDIPTWQPLCYSTDISAAWKVVEEIREDASDEARDKFTEWVMYFADIYPQDTATVAISKILWTSPESICKATLLAKLKEIES